MSDTFANITKRGVDQNKTVAEAAGEIVNVGEEKYAMADKRKVVKTAAGHETISFTDTDTKIVNGTAEVVANSDGTVSISPTDANKTTIVSGVNINDFGTLKTISPDTGEVVIGNNSVSESFVNLKGTTGAFDQIKSVRQNNSVNNISMGETNVSISRLGDGATTDASISLGDTSISLVAGTSLHKVNKDGTVTNTNSVAQYDADVSDTATVNKEILEKKLTTGPLRQKVKGWLDPYLITATFDNATRSITYTSSSGTCEFYSDGNFFSVPNGDPKLTGQVPDLNQWVWTYHDGNGDIQSESSVSLNSIRKYNLGSFMRFQKGGTPTTGLSIATINRFESSQANEVENEASYRTKSIINEVPVLFEGTLGGNSVGHTGGIYYSPRDKRFQFDPIAGASKTWVKYYQEGIDDAGENFVKASVTAGGIPYITDTEIGIGATGRLVYNNFNPGLGVSGEWEVLTVPLNDYVGCHFIVADGATRNVLAIIGQTSYNSLADARSGLSSERSGLVIDSDVFRDVGVVGSCIFKSDGSLEYADVDTLSLFDYPAGFVATGISGGTSLNLQNAYDNSTQPQTTTDAVKGSLQIKDGVGGGAPIFEVLNSSDSPVMSVSENGIDSKTKKITNLGSATADTDALNRITADGRYVNKITSTDNAIARYDGTSGEVQNSTFVISDSGDMDAGGGYIVNLDYIGRNGVSSLWGTGNSVIDIGSTGAVSNLVNRPHYTNGAYYDGSTWRFSSTGIRTTAHVQEFPSSPTASAYSWYISDATGTAGNPITWDNCMTLLSNGVLGLNCANNTSIDDAGNKAVPTVEWSKENLLIINGTQAANDWGSNYSSVNIGDNSTIAYNLETSQYGNLWTGINFYVGNDGIPRYKNNGTSVIHRTRNDNTTSFANYIIDILPSGTADNPVGPGETFTFSSDGTLNLGAETSDITLPGHVTTKDYVDSKVLESRDTTITDQNTTLTSTDCLLVANGTTTQTITLPAANAVGANKCQELKFKNLKTAGTLTIERAGGVGGTDNIYTFGSSSPTSSTALATSASIHMVSDGVDSWYVLG